MSFSGILYPVGLGIKLNNLYYQILEALVTGSGLLFKFWTPMGCDSSLEDKGVLGPLSIFPWDDCTSQGPRKKQNSLPRLCNREEPLYSITS